LMHGLGISDRQFASLWILVIITNLSTLLPLPLLHWLPNESDAHDSPLSLPASDQPSSDFAPQLPVREAVSLSDIP
jgi:BT1 family